MRKFTLPAILFTIFAVGSCKDPEPPKPGPDDRGDPTNITVNISQLDQTTRAGLEEDLIKTEWAAGDKAGVYVRFKEDLDAAGLYEIPSEGVISEDKTSADFNGGWKWHAAALPHRFYAYAPKTQAPPVTDGEGNEVAADADPKTIPISLPAAQTQDGYNSEFLSKNNFWIATPREMTAPRNFNDPALAKKVPLEMKSAFSILEFRFASWEGEDLEKEVIIQKLTLTSNKRPLALSKGTVDITKPAYDTNFGVITADEADFSSTVTLDIANGADLPKSERKTVILGNRAKEPFNIDAVFPARMLVMPNRSIPLGENEEEQWTLNVDFTIDDAPHNIVREFATSRPLRAGERHAISMVLVTAEGALNPPPPEQPGTPWDGTTKTQPSIDDTGKVISISTPAELAWLADAVNNQTVVNTDGPRLYDGYTVRFTQNINLGNKPWTSIGSDVNKSFRGSIDGGDADVDGDGKPDGFLVSGLNVNPTALLSSGDTEVLGLFGRVEKPSGETATIRNLRVKGNINIPNIYDGKYPHVGGVAAIAVSVPISGCRFEGNITGRTPGLGRIGGIVAQSNSDITGCRSAAVINVTSAGNVSSNFGGIVGQMAAGAVKACEFTGSIRVSSGDGSIGGIVGENNVSITACRSTGDLNADDGMEIAVGGIAGAHIDGTIMASYNTGDISVNGSNYNVKGSAGGIAGVLYSGTCNIRSCYSRGKVTASRQYTRVAGNIFGRVATTGEYNYSRISYNYYLYTPLFADQSHELELTSVMQFTPLQWPQISYPNWGVGDGSGNNTYWNETFPDSYGIEDWEYPQLYWEVIE